VKSEEYVQAYETEMKVKWVSPGELYNRMNSLIFKCLTLTYVMINAAYYWKEVLISNLDDALAGPVPGPSQACFDLPVQNSGSSTVGLPPTSFRIRKIVLLDYSCR
jgi:hypothetical protein